MTQTQAQQLLDHIVGQIFGYKNPLTLDQFIEKFTFDISLPQQVTDSTDNTPTWSRSANPSRFMKMQNARNKEIGGASLSTDHLRPARPLNTIEDVMAAWNEINYTVTERIEDSVNVAQSDNIKLSENIYRSQDIRASKNVLFSDGVAGCENIAACQRGADSTFCIRMEDSIQCSNSFSISWSARITNCFFMHDAGDMQDSMFCTNIKGKKFCIANMQYDEAEYKKIRDIVARWILTS